MGKLEALPCLLGSSSLEDSLAGFRSFPLSCSRSQLGTECKPLAQCKDCSTFWGRESGLRPQQVSTSREVQASVLQQSTSRGNSSQLSMSLRQCRGCFLSNRTQRDTRCNLAES